jgi:DNA-binding NarL/FixJ family response regulator
LGRHYVRDIESSFDPVVEDEAALLAFGWTPQELQVLKLVLEGSSTSEVAEALDIDRDTERELVLEILAKLQEYPYGEETTVRQRMVSGARPA